MTEEEAREIVGKLPVKELCELTHACGEAKGNCKNCLANAKCKIKILYDNTNA